MARIVIVRPGECVGLRTTGCKAPRAHAREQGAPGPCAWSERARPCGGCVCARGGRVSRRTRSSWERAARVSFPSVFGSGCPVASSHRLLCHGILSENPPLSTKKFQAYYY